MGIEIERAFLVNSSEWESQITDHSRILHYGYFKTETWSICIRYIITFKGEEGRINIKSRGSKLNRKEYEVFILPEMAKALIEECDYRLIKVRHFVGKWEIDEFLGRHNGLVLAEIELKSPDEEFEKPSWLGEEVTDNLEYSNEMLAKSSQPPTK